MLSNKHLPKAELSSAPLTAEEATFLLSTRDHWSDRALPIEGKEKLQSICGLNLNYIKCINVVKNQYQLICYRLVTEAKQVADEKTYQNSWR